MQCSNFRWVHMYTKLVYKVCKGNLLGKVLLHILLQILLVVTLLGCLESMDL